VGLEKAISRCGHEMVTSQAASPLEDTCCNCIKIPPE